MYGTEDEKDTKNIIHNIRYSTKKAYSIVNNIYKVHTSKRRNGCVCEELVWRAGKPSVHKQYGKCTVSIRKQEAKGKTCDSCARVNHVINHKCNTNHTCVTEYGVANKCKKVCSRQSKINGKNDGRSLSCKSIHNKRVEKRYTVVVTICRLYTSEYEKRRVKSVLVSNVKIYLSVFVKMDPRILEELDRDMDTDFPKTAETHGKKCPCAIAGELTEQPVVNPMSSINVFLLTNMSAGPPIGHCPCINPYDVTCICIPLIRLPDADSLLVKSLIHLCLCSYQYGVICYCPCLNTYSKMYTVKSNVLPSPLICLHEIDTMFVNPLAHLCTCPCSHQYGVICTVNEPQQEPSKIISHKTYVSSTTSRLYTVVKQHKNIRHTAYGDRPYICKPLPNILG
jgi:hypothetical protein